MGAPGKDAESSWPDRLWATEHPIRLKIVVELGNEELQSAAEIARRIEVPVRSVRHQLAKLVSHGLVEVGAERHRRGALERLYRLRHRLRLDSAEHEEMTPTESRRVTGGILRTIAADLTRALLAETFTRKGSSEFRLEAEVDEQGWAEIARIMRGALEGVEAAGRRAAGRLARDGQDAWPAVSALLWFERAAPAGGVDGAAPPPSRAAGDSPRAAGGPPLAEARREDRSSPAASARLAAAMAHPVRAKVVIALSSIHPPGIAQIAEQIHEPRHKLRYHLHRLLADGLVERHPASGRAGNRYALSVVPLFEEEDTAPRLTRAQDRYVWSEIFRRILVEAAGAISAGTFFRRSDFCECRIPVMVDRQGWTEIVELSRRTAEAVDVARSAAAGRLAASGARPIAATAAILWLELPPGA